MHGSSAFSHLSSTLLRQIAQFEGSLEKFLPGEVRQALEKKVRERAAAK